MQVRAVLVGAIPTVFLRNGGGIPPRRTSAHKNDAEQADKCLYVMDEPSHDGSARVAEKVSASLEREKNDRIVNTVVF